MPEIIMDDLTQRLCVQRRQHLNLRASLLSLALVVQALLTREFMKPEVKRLSHYLLDIFKCINHIVLNIIANKTLL